MGYSLTQHARKSKCSTYNLELDGLALHLNRADLEVHADGGDVALRVRVVREAKQQAGLAHARVADQQQLEQVVAVFCLGWVIDDGSDQFSRLIDK